MSVQNLALTVGNLAFAVALLRAVFASEKPPLFTSALTAFWLAVFAFVYGTQHFYSAASATGLLSMLWFILAVQVILRDFDSVPGDQ